MLNFKQLCDFFNTHAHYYVYSELLFYKSGAGHQDLVDVPQCNSREQGLQKKTCHRYGDHFICSMPAISVPFIFIIERSVLRVLVFYYKGLLGKVTMQRTQQFSAVSLLPKEPS